MASEKRIISKVMKLYKKMAKDDESMRWNKGRSRLTIGRASKFFIRSMLNQMQDASVVREKGEYFVREYYPNKSIWKDIANTKKKTLANRCKKGFHGKSFALGVKVNKFPLWLHENAKIMNEKYNGDPRKIWENIESDNIKIIYKRLKEFSGIGDALAKMMQFLLVRKYGIAGGVKSKKQLFVKPDIHLQRVCYRLGLVDKITAKAVTQWEKKANLDSPIDFDAVIWRVGRDYCDSKKPKCSECPLEDVCKKIVK